jgi:hypothetical protein
MALYCSKECQVHDFKARNHRGICQTFQQLNDILVERKEQREQALRMPRLMMSRVYRLPIDAPEDDFSDDFLYEQVFHLSGMWPVHERARLRFIAIRNAFFPRGIEGYFMKRHALRLLYLIRQHELWMSTADQFFQVLRKHGMIGSGARDEEKEITAPHVERLARIAMYLMIRVTGHANFTKLPANDLCQDAVIHGLFDFLRITVQADLPIVQAVMWIFDNVFCRFFAKSGSSTLAYRQADDDWPLCHWCQLPAMFFPGMMLYCDTCKEVSYCSEKCQHEDWDMDHHYTCQGVNASKHEYSDELD